jgi:hypothetical protein
LAARRIRRNRVPRQLLAQHVVDQRLVTTAASGFGFAPEVLENEVVCRLGSEP